VIVRVSLSSVTATGADYDVELLGPVDHAAGSNENDLVLGLGYTLTDGDDDTASGSFTVTIDDDLPVITSDADVTVDEDGLPAGNDDSATGDAVVADGDGDADETTSTGALVYDAGADGLKSLTLDVSDGSNVVINGTTTQVTSDGVGLVWSVNADATVIEAVTDDADATVIVRVSLSSVTATGADYDVELLGPVDHAAGSNENDLVLGLGYILTDGDDDTASGSFTVTIDDDLPIVSAKTGLVYANSSNPAPGGTGVFDYSIGADGRASYSESNSDFSTISLSGMVGALAIIDPTVTWSSESTTTAVFDVSFSYAPNLAIPDDTVSATGTLTFDKDEGTYTLSLDGPIQGFNIVTTSNALDFQGYASGSSAEDNSGPADVVVAQLTDSFFVQFTGIDEPGGGTGSNNLFTEGDGNAAALVEGDLFSQAATSVTVSSTAAGVAGNTIQKGEVLDMDFFTFDPQGFTASAPDTLVTDMFLKFDGIGSEDLVVVLKLIDPDTLEQSTKAIIVDNADIFKLGDTLPDEYNITLDNNDGAVIIESNDYNGAGENWLIEGAQILVSTEGITGSAINLNGETGDTGGSSGTQDFGPSTVDNDVIKITDIGLVTVEGGNEDADLTFQFSLSDGDGDTTATQTLDVHIESGTVFAGGDGADSISDGSGSDLIIGGGGADLINLVADDETDVMDYNALSEIGDTINGFDTDAPGDGDVLDLADLLNTGTFMGVTLAEATVGGYVVLEDLGSDTAIKVDLDGGANAGDLVTVATITSIDIGDLPTTFDDNIVVV